MVLKLPRESLLIQNKGQEHSFPLFMVHLQVVLLLMIVLHSQSQLKAELSEVKTTLATEKALNAKRHEDLLSSFTANLTRPPPSPYSLPCSLHVSPLLFFLSPCLHHLYALFICTVCLTLVISYPGYFALLLCLVQAIIFLCVTRMADIINVPYTWVYRKLFFFPPLPKWWWLQTPWFTMFALITLFRWCQKGEDRYDHGCFGLIWLELISSKNFSSLAWRLLH